jgi:hypothetical protein
VVSERVMISDKYKCIFIHTERTGGTSIERSLLEIGPDDRPEFLPEMGPKHIVAREARDRFGAERWNKYFKFSIVRNPWDLVVSNYFFPWWHKAEEEIVFKDWLLRWIYKSEWNNTIKQSTVPQISAISIDGEIAMDYIIRYEKLEEQWLEVSSIINASPVIENNWNYRVKKYPYLKKRKEYPFYYDEESIEIVYNKYRKDIEYFGYKFGENIIKK